MGTALPDRRRLGTISVYANQWGLRIEVLDRYQVGMLQSPSELGDALGDVYIKLRQGHNAVGVQVSSPAQGLEQRNG